MFTLKLYRRLPAVMNGDKIESVSQVMHMVLPVHHVTVHEIGQKGQAIEIHTFSGESSATYGNVYYVGAPEEGMDAYGREGLHLENGSHSWWGWGLLENWEGNTSEHYRPHSYG
jgi:hypothetical protein